MYTKIAAAKIATHIGADMAIVDSTDLEIVSQLLNGENVGTLFTADESVEFDIMDFILNKRYLAK